jgi:tetraacyldisaccharide 4'-kinase
MLARALPRLVVIANERRALGCETAVQRFGAQRIVLDDAFQHRACARNADLVAIDAMRDLSSERLLPFGRLREPLSSLRRASLVILTRCESAATPDLVEAEVRACTDAPVFRSRYEASSLRLLATGAEAGLGALQGRDVYAFCGIASPQSFRSTAEGLGARLVGMKAFRDHHPFTATEVERVREEAAGLPLLTTEKDAMRLASLAGAFGGVDVYYPVMRAGFEQEELLFARIAKLLASSTEQV